MNRTTPALAAIAAILVLIAGSAVAHDPPVTTDPVTTDMDNSRPDVVKSAVTMSTETGTKTVRSGMPAQPDAGPAPPFAVLDKGQRGYLDQADAEGYPLLSTDFIKADENRDGKISQAEYEKWAAQP